MPNEHSDSPKDRVKSITSQMSLIDAEIMICTKCRLHEGRLNAVPGDGKIADKIDIMIVGEAPGRNEDIEGKPFVGSGGMILESTLKNGGFEKGDVYITNIVKCRPPKNRKPKDDEIAICTSNYLQKQIEILKPKLICTLGATSLEHFTAETNMGQNHGRLHRTERGQLIFPTYHPAAIFRNNSLRPILAEDIKKIPSILKSVDRVKGSD